MLTPMNYPFRWGRSLLIPKFFHPSAKHNKITPVCDVSTGTLFTSKQGLGCRTGVEVLFVSIFCACVMMTVFSHFLKGKKHCHDLHT